MSSSFGSTKVLLVADAAVSLLELGFVVAAVFVVGVRSVLGRESSTVGTVSSIMIVLSVFWCCSSEISMGDSSV